MSRFIFSVSFILFFSISLFSQANVSINVDNIDIVRDEYGVPHIFTKTDVEAVYGIAWAQCEDNFNMMQINFGASRGFAGRLDGKRGAALDFIFQSFEVKDFVEKRYEQDITPEMDKMINAYAAALNQYALTHPKEVEYKKMFPLSAKDIMSSYSLNFLLTHSSIMELGKLLSKKYEYGELNSIGRGSNAMAFNENKTTDGKAYLVGNPHQPVNDFAAWWEVSVHSEEGYEFFGATFAGGGMTPVIGSNKNLGWTHTTNYQNCGDVYQLEMHPTKKNHYKYDGEWLPLEQKKVKLKVKLGFVTIPVGKKYYLSKYGPTFKKKSGYYSYKTSLLSNLKAPEQWYKMGLASNIEEFKAAVEIQGVPVQTITYVDKESNIWHVSPTIHPVRDESYDWSKILAGNTSANNWDASKTHPTSSMPQIENPECGYLYDCNNTPFKMTAPEENIKPEDYPSSFVIPTHNTIRSNSFEDLIKTYDKVSYEDARKMRESVKIDKYDLSFRHCMNCGDIPRILEERPELSTVKKIFDKWDGHFTVDNKQASLISLSIRNLSDYIMDELGNVGKDVPEDVLAKAFLDAEKFMMKHYGTLEVELGEIQKAVRNGVEMPMYGNINTLAAAQFKPYKKKKLELTAGDSFLFYAKYGKDGLESMESINAFGNSNKEGDPHNTDQTKMYVNQQTKKVELDVEILKAKGKVYHPK